MGTVMVHKKDKNYHEHETTTLERSSFSIGDYIDVSINYQWSFLTVLMALTYELIGCRIDQNLLYNIAKYNNINMHIFWIGFVFL